MATDAVVYFDTTSDPQNPGWVCELRNETMDQFAMDETNPDAADDDLILEAASFATGEISVRR
jgi:hypothetical protein